jgi:hypothetical protein
MNLRFLASALVKCEWSASRSCRFIPWEIAPGTHWIGGWVDLRAGLANMEKEDDWPYRDSKSNPSLVQHVTSHYTNYATAVLEGLGTFKNSNDLIEF